MLAIILNQIVQKLCFVFEIDTTYTFVKNLNKFFSVKLTKSWEQIRKMWTKEVKSAKC